MTRPRRRRFRLVHEAGTKRPWVVQHGDNLDTHTWADIARFHDTDHDRAVAYLDEIRRRDQALYEHSR